MEPSRSAAAVAPLLALALLAAGLLAAAPPAEAQYFGRNKVLWEDFPFHRTESEHFELYYYPADHPAIGDLTRMAERWEERLSAAFQHELSERKPIVFYADQPDFRQTTVSLGLIGEGVGGFTEPLLNRVVLPLAGTYAETDHVLGHELVHAFQYDIANALARQDRQTSLSRLPLWMVEGLAEYFSVGRQDAVTAMWLRDALARDALPGFAELNRGGEYNPYRFGHAFYAWMGGRWDDFTVSRFFATALTLGPRGAFQDVLEMEPDAVFEQWHADVREDYGPVLEGRTAPADTGRAVLTAETTGGDLNLAPALSPDGRRIAFLSSRGLFTLDLYLADAETGEVERRLVSAAGNPHFDSLRFLDSAGAWSPDGERFAFVGFAKGDQTLVVVDVDSGDVLQRFRPALGALGNPAWSPDGRHVAFSGSENGLTDLYLLEVGSGEVRRLTDDPYADLQPAFSPDGRTLAFVTDRGPGTDLDTLTYARPHLALHDLESGSTRVLEIFPGARHVDPHFSPDGASLYFVADPGGVSDVYRMELAGRRVERLTHLTTGASGITALSPSLSVAADSGDVAFSVYNDFGYQIRRLPADAPSAGVVPGETEDRTAAVLPPLLPGAAQRESTVAAYLDEPRAGLPAPNPDLPVSDYRIRLRPAYVGPPTVGVGADRYGLGVAGSVSAFFSDVLNHHLVGVTLRGGTSSGDFGGALGGQVSYLNQTNRLLWGAEGTHLPIISARTTVRPAVVEVDGQPVAGRVVSQVREEITIDDVGLLGQYPLSRTRRFEAGVGFTRYGFDREVEELLLVGNTVVDRNERGLAAPEDLTLYRGSLAFVGDSSYYGFVSPVRGGRYRFEVEANDGDLSYQSALADYRRYVFARPVTFAVRGLHFGRYGDDAEDPRLSQLYAGRETLVRGYGIGDVDLSECTQVESSAACPELDRLVGSRLAVVNLELRVPLFGVEEFGLFEVPWLPTELVAFVDAGAAWTEDESPDLRFDEDTADRVPVVSAGLAARMVIGGYLPLELYYAHPFQRPQEDWQFGLVIAPGW